jgi:hypothetical protein
MNRSWRGVKPLDDCPKDLIVLNLAMLSGQLRNGKQGFVRQCPWLAGIIQRSVNAGIGFCGGLRFRNPRNGMGNRYNCLCQSYAKGCSSNWRLRLWRAENCIWCMPASVTFLGLRSNKGVLVLEVESAWNYAWRAAFD